MRNYSSGEDSDENDTPNIVSFQKNARRNAELIRQFVPHMNPEHASGIPPMLMKNPYVMHEDLLRSGFFSSHRSSEPPEGPASAVSAEPLETPSPSLAAGSVEKVDPPSQELSVPQEADLLESRRSKESVTLALEELVPESSSGVLV